MFSVPWTDFGSDIQLWLLYVLFFSLLLIYRKRSGELLKLLTLGFDTNIRIIKYTW